MTNLASTLNRRRFCAGVAGSLGLGVMAGCRSLVTETTPMRSGDESAGGRPNILIIITDQQNIDTIAAHAGYFRHPAHGCHWVHTPNLDRLAREGVSFLESHSVNPVCCPARSCVFTGRMSIETGVIYNNIGIDQGVPNMGQWLEQHSDYECVYCGKWHAGGKWNYPDVDGPRKIPGFATLPVGSKGTGDFADYQVSTSVDAFVRSYREDHPFLLVAGLMNPHDICHICDSLAGKVATAADDTFGLGEDLPVLPPNHTYSFREPKGGPYPHFTPMRWRNYTYDYYRMVEKVDADVGRMLAAVRARSNDTLVIFTSDHGEGLGRHGRVAKWHPYDESVKVPMLVWWPGRVRQGVVDAEHLVSGVDVMSTVCDYAGVPQPPQARGLSLRPLLEGAGEVPWRDHVYAEMQHTGRMIRTERYKFVTFYRFSGDPDRPFVRRDDGRSAVFEQGHGQEYEELEVKLLFDMQDDPWETRNLWEEPGYGELIARHRELLDEWEAQLVPGVHYDRN